jgi:N-acetyl-anhydromuramyl-L-alanine amidase AmpD
MDKIHQYGKFKPKGKTKQKSQIILCHSSREAEEYLASLQFRHNGKFDRIPNFFISKTGEVFQFLDEQFYTNFFNDNSINQKSIIIVLENLGWLEKKPLSNSYINWKGSIYKDKVFEKKWRDYFFWDPYTDHQVDVLSDLCLKICDDMSIEKKCSGHNTKIDGIKNFEGIVSRSNYDSRFTDLNPSFNFEKILKKLDHERVL